MHVPIQVETNPLGIFPNGAHPLQCDETKTASAKPAGIAKPSRIRLASAAGVKPLGGGGKPCEDGTSFQQMAGESNLSGRFSADDQSLSASEVNSYRLTTGEPVTYTWDWQATRQH